MKLQISESAWADLDAGRQFYENQCAGIGAYFLDSLISDIDSLMLSAGAHRIVGGYHRIISKRFPFAIYYCIEGDFVRIRRVLDCRQNPNWIGKQLRKRN